MEHPSYPSYSKNKSVIKSILKDSSVPDSHNYVFPTADRIPNEKIREAYSKLQQSYKEVVKDKEQILSILREETLKNDEQRNYIEMLKQTLESNLVKFGMNPLKKPMADVAIDIVQLRHEAETCRKELYQYENLVTELKKEIGFLRDTNCEMNMKKDKIKESLENGIQELEEAKERVQSLEMEKDYVVDELNELRDYNERVLKDYEMNLERNAENEKEIDEFRIQMADQNLLENKLVEYKNNFEKMSSELEVLFNDKETIEEKYNKVSFDYEELNTLFNNYRDENEELKSEIEEEKLENKEIKSLNEKLKLKNEELNNNLNNSLKLLSEIERSYKNLHDDNNKLQSEFNECKKNYEESDYNKNNLIKEKDIISVENNKIKNENLQIILENDKFKLESNEFSNNFNKILHQYEILNKNFKNLESLYNTSKMEKENIVKESSLIKEKYNNEDYIKTKEINRFNLQINSLKSEKTEMENFLNSEITKLKEEYNISLITRNESELRMKKNFEELLNNKNYLDIELIEKENYINSLEDEMKRFYNPDMELKDQYQNLLIVHEKILKELQSFKNDNKKIYDQNKKLIEENQKAGMIFKENKFYENIIIKILKSNNNKEIARLYNEIINTNNLLLNFESDKSKILTKMDHLEKESMRTKNNNMKDNFNIEIDKLRNIVDSFELKILEKKENVINYENQIRAIEEKHNKGSSTAENKEVLYNKDAKDFINKSDQKKLNIISSKAYENKSEDKYDAVKEEYPMYAPSSSYYKRVTDVKEPNYYHTNGRK